MVLGVSTRNYARSLEPTPAALTSRAASKSAVSRRFVFSGYPQDLRPARARPEKG